VAKRKIVSFPELSADARRLYEVLNDETDLAVIVIAASWLDACLGAKLSENLRAGAVSDRLLDPGRGALGTIAIRADACYALKLIEKSMYQDLTTIAQIRNLVAHNHLLIDFGSSDIIGLVGRLHSVDDGLTDAEGTPMKFLEVMDTVRQKFSFTAVYISELLRGRHMFHNQAGPAT
jgi:DNA-binding MltR family transcriptional regulator